MQEIEILIKLLDNKSKILIALQKFKFLGSDRIKDIYFFHPKLDILKPEKEGRFRECLRLRIKKDKSLIAYKKDYFNFEDIWLYSEEHETNVEESAQAALILESLGFKKLVEVDNLKYKYIHNCYEIILEEVKGLGLFLEVEFKGKSKDSVKNIKDNIYRFIISLELKFVECNMGKPEMLYRKKMKL